MSECFRQSNDFDYEIKSTKVDNSGLYICSASNEHGTINRSVQVKVIQFPKSVTIPKNEYVLEEKQSITIPCLLSPEPYYPFNMSWSFESTANDTNDDVLEVNAFLIKSFFNESFLFTVKFLFRRTEII